MKKEFIELKSSWGVTLKNEYINQNSGILTVILPGLGYINYAPLMHYSYKIALELGFDVLSIEYGFQASRNNFEMHKDLEKVIAECVQVLKKSLHKKYRKIVFVGKSLGTVIQNMLSKEFISYDQAHVYLTPIDKTVENLTAFPCLVVTGTKDTKIDNDSIIKMEENKNFELLKIEEGNHSLECVDTLKSINMLNITITEVKEFIIRNLKI